VTPTTHTASSSTRRKMRYRIKTTTPRASRNADAGPIRLSPRWRPPGNRSNALRKKYPEGKGGSAGTWAEPTEQHPNRTAGCCALADTDHLRVSRAGADRGDGAGGRRDTTSPALVVPLEARSWTPLRRVWSAPLVRPRPCLIEEIPV
jgi:hypothetical protein